MSKSTNTSVGFRRRTALVVDDNIHVQRAVAEIVRAVGFEPVVASSRKEAFSLCDRQAFDVAIVDKILVEGDDQNQDGIAILRHISKKNDGTVLALLTGYGKFSDAAQLSKDVGLVFSIEKQNPSYEEQIRDLMGKVADGPQESRKDGSSARMFCGNDHPTQWENKTKSCLEPAVGLIGLINLLDELALTCSPIFERLTDNGIQQTAVKSVVSGLYWSRGVGSAVVIVLAKDNLPEEIPRLETWPANLVIGEIYHQAKRKNLVAAILKCGGLEFSEFTLRRD